MNNAPPPRKNQHASGPVWCENRGRSAVVSLVTPVAEAGPPYIQWCSLLGTNLDCDESCVRRAAKWVGDDAPPDGMCARAYHPVREIVIHVMEALEQNPIPLDCWFDWANAFAAGISSAPRAWR